MMKKNGVVSSDTSFSYSKVSSTRFSIAITSLEDSGVEGVGILLYTSSSTLLMKSLSPTGTSSIVI